MSAPAYPSRLPSWAASAHALRMFTVTEDQAAMIRAAFERGGEIPAASELQRLFPGIADRATATEFARRIAGWMPLPPPPVPMQQPPAL